MQEFNVIQKQDHKTTVDSLGPFLQPNIAKQRLDAGLKKKKFLQCSTRQMVENKF